MFRVTIKQRNLVRLAWLVLIATNIVVIGAFVAFAQRGGVKGLKSKESQLRRQVAQTEKLLRQTKGVKRKSFNELVLLKKQIQLREKLVDAINNEIDAIDSEIKQIDGIMFSLESDITRFKKSYAAAVRKAYLQQDDMSTLLWLLSSKNFTQAYDRIVYFNETARFRKNQIDIVKRTKKYLAQKRTEKDEKRKRQEELLGDRRKERTKLSKAKKQKDRLYKSLRGKERKYQKRIKQYRRELAVIRKKIRNMVKTSATTGNKDVVNKLNSVFEKNRKKLPWPIPMNKGIVTGYFGRSRTAAGGEVINDGIYISTGKGQKVRAVFNGKVTMIGNIPNYGKVVIVQHGSYRTVYANLAGVYVKKGQKVNLLQNIGSVKTNTETGATQLYFQIYREFNPVNPIGWLAGK